MDNTAAAGQPLGRREVAGAALAQHIQAAEPASACFFDQDDESMELGQRNETKTTPMRQIHRPTAMFLSPQFFESRWCVKELNTLIVREVWNGVPCLLPVFYGLEEKEWPKSVKCKSAIVLEQPLREEGDEDGVADLALRLLVALRYHAAPSKREMLRLLGCGSAAAAAQVSVRWLGCIECVADSSRRSAKRMGSWKRSKRSAIPLPPPPLSPPWRS